MSISITFLEPPENKMVMPDLTAEKKIDYQVTKEQVTGEDIFKFLNMEPKTISFVLVNAGKRYLTKDFLKLILNDGDSIKIFPFLIAG